jgi:purine nucleosidase
MRNVIFDHDGGADDFFSLLILLSAKKAVHLSAATVVPGCCFPSAGCSLTQKLLTSFGSAAPVAASDFSGENPFPEEWRACCDRMDAAVPPHGPAPIVNFSAPELLVSTLQSGGPYTVVCTGPLSNIAAALDLQPDIVRHVDLLLVMGGTIEALGNVEGVSGVEWNFHNSPASVARVFEAPWKLIRLVTLDATAPFSVTKPLRGCDAPLMKILREGGPDAGRMVATLYDTSCGGLAEEAGEGLFFWDSLTAMSLLDARSVAWQQCRVGVDKATGRIFRDEDGASVEFSAAADQELFVESLKCVFRL